MKYLIITLILASSAWGQTPTYGHQSVAGAIEDSSAAATAKPVPHKASDPATCSEGERYYNTTTHKGRLCTATNTWSDEGGLAMIQNNGTNVGLASVINLVPGTNVTLATSYSGTTATVTVNATGGSSTSYLSFPAANCQLGAAGTGFTLPATLYPTATCVTGTNSIYGVLSFSNNGAAAAESVQTRVPLMGTVTSIDLWGRWRTSATTGSVVWQVQTACVGDAETGDPAWGTAQTITDAAKGTTLQWNDFSLTGLTSCATGKTMLVKFFRDATHASDDLAAAAELITLGLTINR